MSMSMLMTVEMNLLAETSKKHLPQEWSQRVSRNFSIHVSFLGYLLCPVDRR